ncbi:DUF3892 domain-containing protein [Comamonas testosteroni]|uniref:DUF3892 domain-containing protein n=1 Tax=Comamonas testosteroni TaxID=285 RepID=UPI0026F3215C|nr:DUF3892 domain-containing protein [Comamonas testosteroni]
MPGIFYVSAVEYANGQTHLQSLKVHPRTADGKLGDAIIKTRPEVIRLMKQGASFKTVTWSPGQQVWNIGASLEIMPVTIEYLTTKKDNTARDNLENLPRM